MLKGSVKRKAKSGKLKDLTIGVFRGGVSPEREISLISGQNVITALRKRGHRVVDVDLITKDREEIIEIVRKNSLDLVFIALHGEFGEDGGIQKILEAANVPFTGAGSKASFLAMDKVETHLILERKGIPMPKFWIYDQGLPDFSDSDFPLVVKPHYGGSSIGISIARSGKDLASALGKAKPYSPRVIVEKYIKGREFSVGIVGPKILPVVEIVAKADFYDYYSKYQDDRTKFIVPAELPVTVYGGLQKLARDTYRALSCRHLGRVDFMLDNKSSPYVLELNSIPGLTSHSLLPLAAGNIGWSFEDLCEKILDGAFRESLR